MPQMTGEDARAQAAPRRLPTEQAKRMKIISFGSEAVGKSCLVKRFCEEKFVSKYISTIGVDFGQSIDYPPSNRLGRKTQ